MKPFHHFRAGLIAAMIFGLGACGAFAQQGHSIKGSVIDTAIKTRLLNTTIYILNARDSMLCQFAYANQDGTFAMDGLATGKYILLATYPDYADYAEPFYLDEAHPSHDFGAINMQLKARLLHEVIIKGAVTAIKIKGDTTEFNAKAYVIQPNDKVEDLLKQFPGIQVDKNGAITANGEKVTKVLLDGEEFFGDDPTLVTKNIRADMVDKVQLYDKKSDQATFTGIDDGVKIKTLNVKLREDKNRGAFGKMEAGAGNPDFYQVQALYNHFKPGEKYAAYGTAANTGKISIGQADNSRLGAGGNNAQLGDVVIMPLTGTDDQDGFNGVYNERGLPVARTGGLHYDNKWKGGKEILNTNYKTGYLDINGINTVISEQTLPSGVLGSNTSRNYNNSAFRQKLDGAYQLSLDSSSNLKITADGTLKNTQSKNNYLTNTTQAGNLLNRNMQSQRNNTDLDIFNASAFYTKKFKRSGRTLSWLLSGAYNRNQTTGYQNSALDFYNISGTKDSTRLIDQYKTTDLSISLLSSNITYSEPLSKRFALVSNYGIGINNSSANRATFKASAPGRYDRLDTVYSNNYQFNQLTNQFGAVFNYHYNKTVLNFGTKVSLVDFEQTNVDTKNIYRRNFMKWMPQVSYIYRISQQKSFTFNYNGNTIQPTIDQVQPVKVNNDPLNIILGNPDLQPSFSHRFSFRYRFAQPFSGMSLNLSGSYALTPDAIVNSIATDAAGKNTFRFVNLQGQTPYSYSFSTDFGFAIKPVDINAEIELFTKANRAYNYSNNVLITSNSNSYWASLQLRKDLLKKYSLSAVVAPNYTFNTFSLQQRNNNAAGFYSDGSATIFLPAKFQFATNISYNYTAATQNLEAQYRTSLNAFVAKNFLKNDALKLSFIVNNLLDQNMNLNRSVSANSITQSSYNTIGRYFFLSLSWDFSKFGTNPVKN